MVSKIKRIQKKAKAAKKPPVDDIPKASLLQPVLSDDKERAKEYRRRRDFYVHQSVHPADEEEEIAQGWELERRLKKKVKLKRLKSHFDALEDRVWCLFYSMGYPELGGTHFTIQYERHGGSTGKKEIDVFAKDDETVVIIECKSRATRGKRPLQKDLHETGDLQKYLANSIRKYYGNKYKPKIIWIYVSTNIIWSLPDVQRADAANIRIITENELPYYEAFIKHLGPAGRFQFLAEFLRGQEIPGLSQVVVPAVRGRMGGNLFYSFVTTPRNLLKISFVNHQALNHPEGQPAYQRMISSARIREIGKFIKDRDGYFPTNILINFDKPCTFDLISNKENRDKNIKFGWLHLPNTYKSAWIIDGQHRLYGFSHLEDEYLDGSLLVIAFEQLAIAKEADLFVTINQKARRVPPGVLVALKADLHRGSSDPQDRVSWLSAALLRTFNADPTSPMFQRFKVEGLEAGPSQNLTLSEGEKGLLRSGLLGRVEKINYAPGYLSASTDEKTIERAKHILYEYFNAVYYANRARWEAGSAGHISVNPGFRAHIQLTYEILRHAEYHDDCDPSTMPVEKVVEILKKKAKPVLDYIKNATDAEIEDKFSRKYGEGGVKEYFFNLCEILYEKDSTFGSNEFKLHITRRDDARVADTTRDVLQMAKKMVDTTIKILKEVHGIKEMKSGEKAYWDLGVENQNIRDKAFRTQQAAASDVRLPKEEYLDVIDIINIAKQANNWTFFKPIFNIMMPQENKGRQYYLGWIGVFNKIRIIAAHATSLRTFSEEDYAFFEWIKNEFNARLNADNS